MNPRISDILNVRSEVREGRIVGVVKVENVHNPGAVEADPEWVFSRTCVLDDELNLLTLIKRKLTRDDPVGNILLVGDMGSGKSHLLLLAYHMFNQPDRANEWLEKLTRVPEKADVRFSVPTTGRVVVIQVKEVEAAYEYLWDIIFGFTNRKDLIGKFVTHSPGMEEMRRFLIEAGADQQPFVLILDEVEPWFNEISDRSIRERNRSFLEKLSELANDEGLSFLLVTAVRAEFDDPKRTLSRECRPINLTAGKRMRIIPYRLFEEEGDEEAIKEVARSYVDDYKRYASDYTLLYTDENVVLGEMRESYPFHPIMLHVLFKKYTSHPSYQNTRGLLYLLSNVVRDLVDKRDMFLVSDANVEHYKDLVGMLDRKLIGRAITCIDDARRSKIEYGAGLISALFYHSLVEAEAGATELELLQSVFRPGMNPTEVVHSIHSVADTCTYVKPRDARFLLGPENPESVVKKEASRIPQDKALGEIADILNEMLGKARRVYLIEFPSEKIEGIRDLRIVFTLTREDTDDRLRDRLEPYLRGKQYPNFLVFMVPERGVDLSRDEELITLAMKAVSARNLSRQPGDLKREYERILREKRDSVAAKLRGESWAIIRWIRRNGDFDIRPLPIEAGKLEWPEVHRKLEDTLWDKREAESIILSRVRAEKDVRIKSVLDDFHTIRGHPLPLEDDQVYGVVRKLCSNGDLGVEQRGKQYYMKYIDTFDHDAKLLHPSLIRLETAEVPERAIDLVRERVERERKVTPEIIEPITEEPRVEKEIEEEIEATLADTGDRFVKISALVSDVENKLQEIDLADRVVVRSPVVDLTFEASDLRRLGDFGTRFSDLGVRGVEADLRISFTELKGKELLDWLRRAPDVNARVVVRGKVARRA